VGGYGIRSAIYATSKSMAEPINIMLNTCITSMNPTPLLRRIPMITAAPSMMNMVAAKVMADF